MPHSKILFDHLTATEFAKKKNISTVTVYEAIKNERIDAVYVGKSERVFIDPKFLSVVFRKKFL